MTVSDDAKKVLEGVTPGPWWVEDGANSHAFDKAICADGHEGIAFTEEPNADFIAWAREGVPALLAEMAAKDAEIARLREAMAPFDRMSGAMFARNWNKDGVVISFVEKDGPIRLTFADFLAVRAAMKGDTHE